MALSLGRWRCTRSPCELGRGLVADMTKTASEESHGQGPLALPFLLLKTSSSKSKCHPCQVPGVLHPLPNAGALPVPRQPDTP